MGLAKREQGAAALTCGGTLFYKHNRSLFLKGHVMLAEFPKGLLNPAVFSPFAKNLYRAFRCRIIYLIKQ